LILNLSYSRIKNIKVKKQILIFLLITVIMFSCHDILPDLEKEKQNVINTDLEFSNLSKKEGMIKAFLTYADDDAVILKNNSMPIIGKEKIGEYYTSLVDSAFILTWKPVSVFISQSADLAYTFGTYTLEIKHDISQTRGTYCSIWKKQLDGDWKWVLDTGNEGLK